MTGKFRGCTASQSSAEEGSTAAAQQEQRSRWLRPGIRVTGLAVGVLAFSLYLQWLILPPPQPFDSYHLFGAASVWPHIPAGRWPLWQLTRVGLLLPTWAAQRILGPGQAAFDAASFLLIAVLAVGCYLAGRAMFGDLTGLAAAALVLIHPFFTVVDPYVGTAAASSTGAILPDPPAAGLFACGMAGLVVASRRTAARQVWVLIAAGLSFGAAFLCREFVAFMYAGIPLYFLLLRIRMWRIVIVAAPMLAVLAGDLVHNAIVFHDPLAQLHADQAQARYLGVPLSLGDALGRFPQAMGLGHPSGVIFLVALGLNAAGLAITRDRRLAITLIWFLSLWIPLTLLGGILDPARPLFPWGYLARYWFPVLPAVTIGGIGACILLVRRIPWRGAQLGVALAAGAALAVTYVAPAVADIAHVRRDTSWNQLRAWLSRHPDVRVLWTDSYSAQTLYFYTKTPRGKPVWHGTVETFTKNVPGSAVYRPMFVTSQSAVPPALIADWRVLWRSPGDGSLKILIKPSPRSRARA